MVLADLVAGTFAGFGICAVGHPFDTLKVLMQTQPGKYSGMGAAARETLGKHGVFGLYKGVASPAIGMGIFNAVQFTVFSAAKNAFTNQGKDVTLNRIAAAAGFTGIFVAFVEGPQDLFKCQMQAQMSGAASNGSPQYKGTLDCARTILRERGVAGALQGINATIMRNIVGVTAYFYIYEYARMKMAGDKPVTSLSPLSVLMAGGLGGVAYWVSCYPLDIIKTAVQCDSIFPSNRKYKSTLDAATKLWAEGGVKRYTAGIAPALARSFPANAAGFAIYEAVKQGME